MFCCDTNKYDVHPVRIQALALMKNWQFSTHKTTEIKFPHGTGTLKYTYGHYNVQIFSEEGKGEERELDKSTLCSCKLPKNEVITLPSH